MARKSPLTNLQRELLELFATDLSEEELKEIKNMLARHFAQKATEQMDSFADQHSIAAEDMEAWAYDHRRTRTD